MGETKHGELRGRDAERIQTQKIAAFDLLSDAFELLAFYIKKIET